MFTALSNVLDRGNAGLAVSLAANRCLVLECVVVRLRCCPVCTLPHDVITLCCSGVAVKQRRHLGQAREHPYQRTGTLS